MQCRHAFQAYDSGVKCIKILVTGGTGCIGSGIDLLREASIRLEGIEIKASSTWHGKFSKQLVRFATNNHPLNQSLVVYNVVELQRSNGVIATSYDTLAPALSA